MLWLSQIIFKIHHGTIDMWYTCIYEDNLTKIQTKLIKL